MSSSIGWAAAASPHAVIYLLLLSPASKHGVTLDTFLLVVAVFIGRWWIWEASSGNYIVGRNESGFVALSVLLRAQHSHLPFLLNSKISSVCYTDWPAITKNNSSLEGWVQCDATFIPPSPPTSTDLASVDVGAGGISCRIFFRHPKTGWEFVRCHRGCDTVNVDFVVVNHVWFVLSQRPMGMKAIVLQCCL